MSKRETVAASTAPRRANRAAAGVLLRAEAIDKHYRMGASVLPVLRNCAVSVRDGEFLSIMGKSGSGKSTLLHILGALDVPQGGQVYFRDEPVFAPVESRRLYSSLTDVFSDAERQRNRIRRTQFGFVFQLYHLLPELSVLENVVLPHMVATPFRAWGAKKASAREAALTLLKRVGLDHRLTHRPSELSGGERQRVAIARALVHQPAVLLADEPTGNLDAEAGGRIMSLLSELHREGQTIVIVTHDSGVAKAADRIVHLEDGRLRDAGNSNVEPPPPAASLSK